MSGHTAVCCPVLTFFCLFLATGYVAAVGIPEYRRDGAVVMMRFASEILSAMGK